MQLTINEKFPEYRTDIDTLDETYLKLTNAIWTGTGATGNPNRASATKVPTVEDPIKSSFVTISDLGISN